MNKKLILLLSAIFFIGGLNIDLAANAVSGPFNYDLQKDINRKKSEPKKWETESLKTSSTQKTSEILDNVDESIFLKKYDINPKYYPNASTKNAIAKYKSGNYTGSLQELYTVLKKDPSNATAFYYLAMVYTKLGEKEAAKACYQRVINLNPNDILVNYSTKGKACLENEAACNSENGVVSGAAEAKDDLDKFIQDPFGTGFSKELNDQLRNKQLQNIQNKMNRGVPLSEEDLKKLEEYNKSEIIKTDKLALADDMPSNDEIINAVKVLKRAGLNISTQMPDTMDGSAASTTSKNNESALLPAMHPANYYTPDPQIQQMSMMLNNGNNNNYNDPMMNMLPYMMQNEGKNINPQVIQSMMMNSMMNSLNGMNTNYNNN